MSRHEEIGELARAAAGRDLAAARKLVRVLEREEGTVDLTRDSWVRIPNVNGDYPLQVEPSLEGRGYVVTLRDAELPRAALEAWALGRRGDLETSVRVHVALLKGGFPMDAALVAAWPDWARRANRFLFLHPSFELTRLGHEFPRWPHE